MLFKEKAKNQHVYLMQLAAVSIVSVWFTYAYFKRRAGFKVKSLELLRKLNKLKTLVDYFCY